MSDAERPAVTRLELVAEEAVVFPPMEERLTAVLNRFPEVEWDRWAVIGGFGWIYGWIDVIATEEIADLADIVLADARSVVAAIKEIPDEEYGESHRQLMSATTSVLKLAEAITALPLRKDFIALEVHEGHVHGFVTSSARHSESFAGRLGFSTEAETHAPCRRVEDDLPGVLRVSRSTG